MWRSPAGLAATSFVRAFDRAGRLQERPAGRGYDGALPRDRPTHLLSYGQRKRAAIAGAVAMVPRVLILDGPTAGLGPDGRERLPDVPTGLRADGTTGVMATHDVDLAVRRADDAAVPTPSGIRTGPVRGLLSDPAPPAWCPAVAAFLRARGLLSEHAPGPRTPEALAGLRP